MIALCDEPALGEFVLVWRDEWAERRRQLEETGVPA